MQYPDELYHHGIKGMRWGVRNGPPYPLYRQSAYWQKYHQRPPGGRIGGFSDSIEKGAKKWRQNLPDKVKYPVAVTAAGAAGLAAGANIAYTRAALGKLREQTKAIPGIGKFLIRGKQKVRKSISDYFKITDKKVQTGILLGTTAAVVGGAVLKSKLDKKRKAREKELKKIRKQRSKIGELREKEAEKVRKSKIGALTDNKPKTVAQKAKDLKGEYNTEKEAWKKRLKGVGIAAGVAGGAYLATKAGFKLNRLAKGYGYDSVKNFLKDVDKREFAILAAREGRKAYKLAGKVGTGLGIAAGTSLAIKKIKKAGDEKQNGKVKGLFDKSNPETKKATSMAHKIEAERSSAKTVTRNGVKVRLQSKKLNESENMERVNNTFRIKRTRGNSENCIACSVTMEARRRGYEVKARTDLAHDDDSETSFKSVAKVYKNAKVNALGTNAKAGSKAFNEYYDKAEKSARKGNNTQLTQKLKSTTKKMPKGASGQICIMFDRWSGHSMYFYKDRNGKTIFYDTQRNKKYTEEQLNSMFIQNSSDIKLQRFDNCDINEKELLKYSK